MPDLVDLMLERCKNRIVYFGSRPTLDTSRTKLNSFPEKTGALVICGYKEDVDRVASTAFDLLFLGKIQRETLR